MNSSYLFNSLDKHFCNKIYNSFKGKLRLAVLLEDFEAFGFNKHPLNILDIGAGQGQYALMLAKIGHKLTLSEPAKIMLNDAKSRFNHEKYEANFYETSISELHTFDLGCFDLVLCHAVLEWLEDPYHAIPVIFDHLKPKDYASLLFYNRDGLIFHNLIRGNFRAVQKEDLGGFTGGLTPINPIDPNTMQETLERQGFSIIKESGVRVFHDYMTKDNQQKIKENERLEMELNYRHHPSYVRSARYLHWIIQKN